MGSDHRPGTPRANNKTLTDFFKEFAKRTFDFLRTLSRTELKTDGGKVNAVALLVSLVVVGIVSVPNWVQQIYSTFNSHGHPSSSLMQPLYVWLVFMLLCALLSHAFQVHLERARAARRLDQRPPSDRPPLPPGDLAKPLPGPTPPNRATRRQQPSGRGRGNKKRSQ